MVYYFGPCSNNINKALPIIIKMIAFNNKFRDEVEWFYHSYYTAYVGKRYEQYLGVYAAGVHIAIAMYIHIM